MCERCGLSRTRKNIVVGRGNPDARVWFVGEAPGQNEDEKGLPFVGAAGKELDKAIAALGLKDDEFYITNTIRCRPVDEHGKNRPPTDEEKEACSGHLFNRIKTYKPRVIIALGKHAMSFFIGETWSVMKLSGTSVDMGNFRLFILLHPAAVLYQPGNRGLWDRSIEKIRGGLNGHAGHL